MGADDATEDLVAQVGAVIGACPVAAAGMDPGGRVTVWNQAASRLFGHGEEAALGASLADLVALPAQRSGGFAAWQQLSSPERSSLTAGLSVLAAHRDGTPLAVQLTVTDLPGGAGIAWFRPVAQVERPATSDDVFRVIFERAPEAITVLDADARQRTVNPAGLALVGLVPGMEAVGDGSVYIHPDDLPVLEERERRRQLGEPLGEAFRYRVSHADGSWRWLESRTVDLRDVPPISGYLVISRDVTDAEEQRRELEDATARLDRLDRSRTRVLSAVSHELRTPLAAIMSASEHLAADQVDTDEVRSYAQLIHRNAARLEAMVADLLLIGHVQSGTLPVELEAVDVPAVVEHAAAAHRTPSGPPVRVRVGTGPLTAADPRRLSQVVDNLVTNGLRYGDATGVDVVATHGGSRWTITVSDRGPGVDPDEREHVTEPFYRGRASRGTPGSGVGLSIATGIVELHGGTLELRPGDGGGTVAVVTLPDRTVEGGDGR